MMIAIGPNLSPTQVTSILEDVIGKIRERGLFIGREKDCALIYESRDGSVRKF